MKIDDYNDSTQEFGRLLERWSLQDSISGCLKSATILKKAIRG